MVREHTGGVRTIFRVHEEDGPTRSQPFHALVRTPRPLRPVQQALKDDAVYVYHTKINTERRRSRAAVRQWHQDYGSWMARRLRATRHGDLQPDDDRHHRDAAARSISSRAATSSAASSRSTTNRPRRCRPRRARWWPARIAGNSSHTVRAGR